MGRSFFDPYARPILDHYIKLREASGLRDPRGPPRDGPHASPLIFVVLNFGAAPIRPHSASLQWAVIDFLLTNNF